MNHLIIGASAAGISCARKLRELDKNCNITIISKDKYVYSRCMLHHAISGHRDIKKLNFSEENFFEKYSVNWVKDTSVISIDTKNKLVTASDGKIYNFDKLLISAGADSFLPPIQNLRTAKNIVGLRHIEDVIFINEKVNEVDEIVVLGAGLVGIDAVIGLIDKGIKINLIEASDRILPLQLDSRTSQTYEKVLTDKGVSVYKSLKAMEVLTNEQNEVVGIKLEDGTIVNCQMIIAATGVRANVSILENSGIETDRTGIVINKKCETNMPDIYAAGDIIGKSQIWPLAVKQAITAAHNMVGQEKVIEDEYGLKNSMNFFGIPTISIGLINKPDNTYTEIISADKKEYKKAIIKDNIVHGIIFQGDISYCGVFMHLIDHKVDISHVQKDIFDIDYSDFFHTSDNGEYNYI
ncbi:MAG: FAD-dependent oxidoreductase [bacterium]